MRCFSDAGIADTKSVIRSLHFSGGAICSRRQRLTSLYKLITASTAKLFSVLQRCEIESLWLSIIEISSALLRADADAPPI